MTIKHQIKNISAEKQYIITDVTLNETTGVLTFTKQNLHDETSTTVSKNLNDIKLRLIKLNNESELEAIKNSNNADVIKERETHIYLVPFDQDGVEEGVYRECVWVAAKNDFEVLGSTKTDLVPIRNDISILQNLLDLEIISGESKLNRIDNIETLINTLAETKVDKAKVNPDDNDINPRMKVLSDNNYTDEEKQKLYGIEDNANNYSHPTYPAKTGKPTGNSSPAFGDSVTVSQIKSDNTGHVSSITDRTITIPSTTANSSTNGLAKATSTTPSDVSLSGSSVGTDNNEFARSDHVHKHPTGISKTGQPTANQSPGFGGNFKVTQFSSNATGHISSATDRTITLPSNVATTSSNGLMSASDKEKLDGIAPGAGHLTVDDHLDPNSTNPVQNAVICENFYDKDDIIELLNSIEVGTGKLLTIVVTEDGHLIVDDDGFDYYTEDEADALFSPIDHEHGNITNDGKIGSTANKPLITTTDGVITTGSFGTTSGTFTEGNDSRLSDARTPTSHTHGDITNDGKLGTAAYKPVITGTGGKIALGSFESTSSNIKMNGTASVGSSNNFVRADHVHPSDTTKVDTAGTGLSKNGTTLNHSNSVTAQTATALKKIKYDSEGHITGTENVTANDLPSSIPTSKITGLSTVATSGSYSDLTNKPSYTPTITSSTTDSYKIGSLNINGSNVDVYGKDSNTIDGEYIEGTQTTSTGAWTGVCKHLTQLVKGVKIYYKLPYAGNGNATLNLTLANGQSTGAINCYYNNTTRLNTQYGINNIIELVYDGEYWRVANPYTNVNYYDRVQQTGQITMGEATATNVIVGGKTDGNYYKIVSGGVYDIRYQLYWTGGAFAINSVNNNIYSAYNYVNLQNTVSGLTVTNEKRIYIECSNYINGQYTISDRVFVSDDNLRTDYYYIPIGMSYSTTNIRFNTFVTNIYVYTEYGLVPYSETLPTPYIDQNYYLSIDYNENILNNPNLLGMVKSSYTNPILTYNDGVYTYTRTSGNGYGYHKIPISELHDDFILSMQGRVNNTGMSDLGFVLANETNDSYEYFNLRPAYSTQKMRYTHCTANATEYTHIKDNTVTGFTNNTWYELVLTKIGNTYTWEAYDTTSDMLIESLTTTINNINIEFIGVATGWSNINMSVKDITITNL